VETQEGTDKWHAYTFIGGRPIRSLKAKIRALTYRNSQQNPSSVLIRLNQIMRGWANYFRHQSELTDPSGHCDRDRRLSSHQAPDGGSRDRPAPPSCNE
jgi:hypothetical protein